MTTRRYGVQLGGVVRLQPWISAVALGCLAATTTVTALLLVCMRMLTALLQRELDATGHVLQLQHAPSTTPCVLRTFECRGPSAVHPAHIDRILRRIATELPRAPHAMVQQGVGVVHSAALTGGPQAVELVGTHAALADLQPVTLRTGRFWSPGEERAGAHVAVLGERLADSLFQGRPPPRLRVGRVTVQVVGTVRSGDLALVDLDRAIAVPQALFASAVYAGAGTSMLLAAEPRLPSSHADARDVLRRLERGGTVSSGLVAVLSTREQVGELGTLESALQRGIHLLSLVLAAASATAVGALSITAARAERRAVGIARAVGATRRDIAGLGVHLGLGLGGVGVLCGWVVTAMVLPVLPRLLNAPGPSLATILEALLTASAPGMIVAVLTSLGAFLWLAYRPPSSLLG